MLREYQTVAVDPEDVEDGIKDARLLALRKEGYSTVAVLTVEQKGRVRLAFILEPPAGEPVVGEARVARSWHPPPALLPIGWLVAMSALLFAALVAMILLIPR